MVPKPLHKMYEAVQAKSHRFHLYLTTHHQLFSQSTHAPCSRGVDLVRIEVISDNKEDIAATALRLRELVGSSGAVITSGGIGPTHDDVTYEALAAAYGMRLALPLHATPFWLIPVHARLVAEQQACKRNSSLLASEMHCLFSNLEVCVEPCRCLLGRCSHP